MVYQTYPPFLIIEKVDKLIEKFELIKQYLVTRRVILYFD